MSDIELYALAVLVSHEVAQMNEHLAKYGEHQFNPVTPASMALDAELERRSVVA